VPAPWNADASIPFPSPILSTRCAPPVSNFSAHEGERDVRPRLVTHCAMPARSRLLL
jgi:hypothetical protein